MQWHLLEKEEVLRELGTSPGGLDSAAAGERLKQGRNELTARNTRTAFDILREQLTATMVLILLGAAVVAALLGDWKNAIAILTIVILYAALGFFQDYRAEQAVAALKRLSVPVVHLLRDGRLVDVPASEVVPGDLIMLEAGNIVPADLRLVEAFNLRIQEAALTGESEPVEKHPAALAGSPDPIPVADRRNMAYMGTIVTQGRASAVATATGMQTELGKIADLLQNASTEDTPLQKRLDRLGKILALAGGLIAGLIFIIGLTRGDDLKQMLLTAVSVAVAIVPEGLPAVVTITLALGAQRMLKRRALMRRLPAVETLGSVTVICSDKTGTLTQNKMTVVALDAANHFMDMTAGHAGGLPPALALLAAGGALCSDAVVKSEEDILDIAGDPTEAALVAAAARSGLRKSELERSLPREAERPFDSDRKRMTTIHRVVSDSLLPESLRGKAAYAAFTKGAVDGLVELSSAVWIDGRVEPMSDTYRTRILEAEASLAARGMRVLGLAFRGLGALPADSEGADEVEQSLIFIGMFGMIDPPRVEVRDAVSMTHQAGIRTIMITGDHPGTAVEIARQLGIQSGGEVLTGSQIEKLTEEDLRSSVEHVRVFARVSPEHKLRIVRALQDRGHIVSMTGDGVNDAPALRRADIGVAMGLTGTDVSREASDLVLLDDNFATIVAAVQEGRTIYENIRKFVRFSVAGNLGKVLVMLIAPFLGGPIPLLPLQLLWLNLLTDGLLGLGLGVEKPEKGTMQRPPYAPGEGIFSRGAGGETIRTGLVIGALALGLGLYYFFTGRPEWQTMIFTSLAFAQAGQALSARSREAAWQAGINPLLTAMFVLTVGLQLLVLYVPVLAEFFQVKALNVYDLVLAVLSGFVVFVFIEVDKAWQRRRG